MRNGRTAQSGTIKSIIRAPRQDRTCLWVWVRVRDMYRGRLEEMLRLDPHAPIRTKLLLLPRAQPPPLLLRHREAEAIYLSISLISYPLSERGGKGRKLSSQGSRASDCGVTRPAGVEARRARVRQPSDTAAPRTRRTTRTRQPRAGTTRRRSFGSQCTCVRTRRAT